MIRSPKAGSPPHSRPTVTSRCKVSLKRVDATTYEGTTEAGRKFTLAKQ
jgi:hypothetical protein